jgi:putative transposase
VHVLLRREGWEINMKKTRRIYNELGLQLRNKHPKRRVKAKLLEDRQEAAGPNEVWAMDFVHDHLAMGKKLRILTVVDTHSRLCPAADPRFAYRGEDVVQTLERVCAKVGYPKTIRVDNGSEFISRDLDLWAYANDVTLDFTRPGKPTDNGFIEALNSKLRAECLNAHWFMSLADARENWMLGVGTTTRSGPTARSDTKSRSPCIIPMAQPARHRERAGKIQLPAVQGGVAVHPLQRHKPARCHRRARFLCHQHNQRCWQLARIVLTSLGRSARRLRFEPRVAEPVGPFRCRQIMRPAAQSSP